MRHIYFENIRLTLLFWVFLIISTFCLCWNDLN